MTRVKLDRVVEDNNESIGVECLLLFEMKNWSLRAREYGMYNTFIGYGVKERTDRGWKGMAREMREGFKEFYEMVTVVDVQWKCSYNRLHKVGDIV